ncbi:hypothetical protein LXL04_006144 [Taraxacum kok-saghyz]
MAKNDAVCAMCDGTSSRAEVVDGWWRRNWQSPVIKKNYLKKQLESAIAMVEKSGRSSMGKHLRSSSSSSMAKQTVVDGETVGNRDLLMEKLKRSCSSSAGGGAQVVAEG